MKAIQSVSAWFEGIEEQANNLNVYSVHDDLASSATFCYQLFSVTVDPNTNVTTSKQLTQGNLTISGTDYINWGNAGDVNNEAYIWSAQQLNLSLI